MHLKRTITYTLLLFLSCFFTSWSQNPSGITTSVGDSTTITICDGDSVTFTLDKVSGVGEGYEFYRIRGGVTLPVRGNSTNREFTTSFIADGDIYYGERYDYDFSGSPIKTDEITFTVQTLSGSSFLGGTIDQASQFNCPGMPGINLTVSGGTTGLSYNFQWQRSIDIGITYSDIPGATGVMFNTGTVTQTTFFRRRVMHNGSGTCEKFSTEYIYEISDLSPGSLDMSSNKSICYDTSPGTLGLGSSTLAYASRGTLTYQWQQNTGSGWTDIPGEINNVYTPPNLTTDIQYRRFATNLNSSGSCGFSTNVISIIIDTGSSTLDGGIINQKNQLICSGDVPQDLTVTGTSSGSGFSYQWQRSLDNIHYDDITSATFEDLVMSSVTQTTYFRRKVKSITGGSCNKDSYSSWHLVEISDFSPGVLDPSQNQTICSGDSPGVLGSGVGGSDASTTLGTISYQWQQNTGSSWIDIPGEIHNVYTPPNLTTDIQYRRFATNITSLGSCVSSTNVISIIIDTGSSTLDGGIINQKNQLICSGDVPQDLTVTGTSSGSGFSYQWQRSLDNIHYDDITSATFEDLVMSSVTQTTYFRRKVKSITGASCKDSYSSWHLVEISDFSPGVLDPSQNQTICSGDSPGVLGSGIGGSDASTTSGTISYQWEHSINNLDWTTIVGATNVSYTPPNLTDTTYFRRIATNIYTSTSSCSIETNVISITISPAILNLTSSAVSNTFCVGDLVTFSASGAKMYEFLINGVVVQSLSTSNTMSKVFTSNATVTVNTDVGICSNTISKTTSLYIEPNPVRSGSISAISSICYEEPVQLISSSPGSINGVTLVGSATGAYQWQASLDNHTWTDVPSATSASHSITALYQSTYFRRNTLNSLNGVECEASTNWIYVFVAPEIKGGTIDQTNQFICLGDAAAPLTISGGTTGVGVTYQWQRSLDNGATYQNIPFETNPGILLNTVTETTRFRRLTLTSNGNCSKSSNEHIVTINDLNPGSLDTSQNIALCYNSLPPQITNGALGSDAFSSTGTITYQWQYSTDSVNWTTVVSATSNSYSPTDVATQTHWLRRVAFATSGSLTCSATTNAIQFLVYDEVVPGNVIGDQTICEGDLPTSLSLVGASPIGLTYQWQSSQDGLTYSNIANSTPSLNFSNRTSWTPSKTTYFRVIVSSPFACTATSTSAKITVLEKPTLFQTSGTPSQQIICPASAIVTSTFEFGGSATGILVSGLAGSGLTLTGPIGNTYTLSGTPVSDVTLTFTTTGTPFCLPSSLQYNVYVEQMATAPSLIRKGVNNQYHSVIGQAGLWYNNTICQSAVSSPTAFFVCESPTQIALQTYEWRVLPGSAGVMNTTTGEISWNNTFLGTALIGVRALSCGGNSAWLDTPIEVIPIGTSATALTTPSVLLNDLCELPSSQIPSCQITTATSNTHFFATSKTGISDYSSIVWTLNNILPGGAIGGVTNPGIIDSATGEMYWNPGFWGSLDIVATAINCDGTNGPSSTLSINLTQGDDTIPNILTVSPTALPTCPTQTGDVTRLRSSLPVTWSIDNDSAGIISSVDSFTGEIAWSDAFSGEVNITARGDGACLIGESTLNVFVPGTAKIKPTLGIDTVTLCQGTFLNGMEYHIEGFPSSASVVNLPDGVTGVFSATHHIIDVLYSGVGIHGQIYRLEILGQSYSYTLSGTETADQMIMGLSNQVNSAAGSLFTATRIAPNTLRLRTNVAGFSLSGTVFGSDGFINVVGINQIQIPSRTLTLTGTVTADPGVYDFTITTVGGSASCNNISRIGRITVTGASSLSLLPGSDDQQEICFGNSISQINYQADNVLYASVTGLPQGLTPKYSPSSGLLEISGTPTELVTQTTNFTYTVVTQNNKFGCSPEATVSGTIIIHPTQEITLMSGANSDNQTICISGVAMPLTPIEYQLSGSATAYSISGLPPGINSNFNPTTKVVTLSGSPTALVTNTMVYTYGITSIGANCSPTTVSGTITIEPSPTIRLISALGTDNQVGLNGACNNTPIVPIVYEFENAASATVTGLPKGLTPNQTGNTISIVGSPNENLSTPMRFTYTITTSGGTCGSNSSQTGLIEVIPMPIVDQNYIQNNDITNVSCNGFSDGAINIPANSPEFDLRISGQQNNIRQIDHVVLINNPNLSDVYTIQINGKDYSHTVIPSMVGGSVQNVEQVAEALVDVINQANSFNAVGVTAAFQTSATVVLTADTPGVPFIVNSVNVNSVSPTTATISHTQITANGTTLYSYSWKGPNGFTSSNLSLNNLSAGTYELTVQINNCVGNPVQFEITEPQPLAVATSLCNGAFEATVTGGTAPYTFKLFDSNKALVRTNVANSAQLYLGLTPGADYLLEVLDSQCAVAIQTAVKIPFGLAFDAAIPTVVDDYCKDNDGDGFIELGNSSGIAFSGGSNQFTYNWSGPDGFRASTRDIYDLKDGRYTVTVTDAVLGCSDTQTFTVGTVTALDIDIISTFTTNASGEYIVNLPCDADNTGEIEIQVTGGVSSTGYTYSWTRDGDAIPSARNAKLSNIGIGVYEVTVSNAPPSGVSPNLSPCLLTETITVKAPDPIQIVVNSGTGTQTVCQGSNTAEIEIEILGGTPPFKVELNDGRAGSYTVTDHKPYAIKNLDPSSTGPEYKITVKDANSCEPAETTTPTTVTFQEVEPINLRAAVTEIDCANGNDGSIVLDIISGKISDPENVQVQWKSATSNLYHTWKSNGGKLENIENGGVYQVIVSRGDCELFNEKITLKDVSGGQLFVNEPAVKGGGCNGDLGEITLSFEGGFPPYSIKWEQYKAITLSSGNSSSSSNITTPTATVTPTSTSPSTTTLTTEYQWIALPQFANDAIAGNLELGTYRAIISDSSVGGSASCGGNTIVTKNLIIGSGVFELVNFEVLSSSLCNQMGDNAQDIQFTIRNTLPLKNTYTPEILLDGKTLKLTEERLKKLGSNSYKIIGIDSGNHSLNIKTGIQSSNASSTSASVTLINSSDAAYEFCEIAYPFTIEEQIPITFEGETNIILNPCEEVNKIEIDPTQVQGGSPFEIDGSLTYDYQWTFTPSASTSFEVQESHFVGNTILNIEAGKYELVITDSKGCTSESILFTVTNQAGATPFEVSGALLQTTSNGATGETTKVKAIAPNCDSTLPNGKIGISISGGLRPYTIEWEKEVLSTNASATGSDANYESLSEYKNATLLTNLESGKYKLILRAQQSECDQQNGYTSKTYYEEIIAVPLREDLYVVEGPFIDSNLCQGNPGKLSLQVYDNQDGALTFYYNGNLVSVDEEASNAPQGTYTLNITDPVAIGQLLVTNAVGCQISEDIILTEIGEPSFEFNSPSLQIDGQILAREEVTFTNTSALPYNYSEWIFGDGSRETFIMMSNTVSPVLHAYGISGTYLATLRNYNNVGCFKEVTQRIVVGKGYNIMAPNAFSPNGDLINDVFRILFNGFIRVQLSVYDNRGNILYDEKLEEPNPDIPQGIELKGWDGKNAPPSPNFIYRFEGYTPNEENPIIESGTFILLR